MKTTITDLRAPFNLNADGSFSYRTELVIAQERIKKLEAALKHAQEALFWHDGMGFEQDGRTVKQAINEALS